MRLLAAVIVTTLTMSAAYAGDRSFRYDPNWKQPRSEQHNYPDGPVSPYVSAFDRNMVPPANATAPSDGYDLSERITFGAPPPKKR